MKRQNAATGSIPPELYVPPPLDHPGQVVAYVSDIKRGGGLPPHQHERAQLLTIVSGSIAVTTWEGTFVVPAERALWIPARTVHETRHLASTRVHTLYITTDATPALPGRTTVLQVNPLLRAIVDSLMSKPRDPESDEPTDRLISVLLDQITSSRILPLHLPMPRDGALRRIAERIVEHPTDARTIEEWSSLAKVSVRTLERRFKSETGFSCEVFGGRPSFSRHSNCCRRGFQSVRYRTNSVSRSQAPSLRCSGPHSE